MNILALLMVWLKSTIARLSKLLKFWVIFYHTQLMAIRHYMPYTLMYDTLPNHLTSF